LALAALGKATPLPAGLLFPAPSPPPSS